MVSALGAHNIFRFDFFTIVNCYGPLIKKKRLLIPFVSVSLFTCQSNWLTKVDLSNRKTTFRRLSTFLCRFALLSFDLKLLSLLCPFSSLFVRILVLFSAIFFFSSLK